MINLSPFKNIYKKSTSKSEVVSQILYGEKFKILNKRDKWIKVKLLYDNYVGFIKNDKYSETLYLPYKISVLKSQIYKFYKDRFIKSKNKFLPFGGKINILETKNKFVRYNKYAWLKKSNIVHVSSKKRFIEIVKLFLNCKYKWGGRCYNGIDCSALIQMYYMYNNIYFPRDTKDQVKMKRGLKNQKQFKKGDIIFWKGHVAICLNKKKLIHAYGPKKKVLIMYIKKKIKLISSSASLEIKKIYSI